MKIKGIFALLLALAMAFALAACGETSSGTDDSDAPTASAGNVDGDSLSGNVATGGSTSMQELMEVLQESFREKQPGVNVTYEPTGSGAGITGAQDGTLDIGLSSRALHEDETGISAVTVALDGIAVVVNAENEVEDLSMEQIASIAKGEITNWSQVGGQDGEIVVIGREASSGTRDGFESILGVSDACAYAQELTSTGAVIAAVQSNPNAIGYASMAALTDEVKAVTVGGVACTEETVQDGTYAIQRPFNFILKDDVTLSPQAQAFLDFVQSDEATELIQMAGAVPLKE